VKVAFCVPSLGGPTAPFIAAMEQSIPLVDGAGWETMIVEERGCPYISNARATMLRKALDAGAEVICFLDYDLSWRPADLLKLIETPDPVVAGTYRYKKAEEEYMGSPVSGGDDRPVVRADGCIRGHAVPAGFLKLTRDAVRSFMRSYPELVYGDPEKPSIDLFNHGAIGGIWYGEDMAFCKRWRDSGGMIWIVPDLSLTHHSETEAFPGNYHEFMLRQPGGSEHEG
jgi:hypothetical protein